MATRTKRTRILAALLCALLVALMLPTAGFAAAGKTAYLKIRAATPMMDPQRRRRCRRWIRP
ncbi:MAG: hypothetical protein ACLUVV_06145 [Christensenellales bacterium]